MKDFPIPVVALGPGSQPGEDDALEYMVMPSGMNTFHAPNVPDDAALAVRTQAAELISALASEIATGGGVPPRRDLRALDPAVVQLVGDALGQGEVSVVAHVPEPLRVQETAFPGLWRIQRPGPGGALAADWLEACAIPDVVRLAALALTDRRVELPLAPAGVMNAPALLAEVLQVAAEYRAGQTAHIVNLTLLPVSPADLDHLVQALGAGTTAILSRGYGNCRISSTAVANVWWVQYFNSMEQLILNTIEVVDIPEVALAAPEDLASTAERMKEWAEALLA